MDMGGGNLGPLRFIPPPLNFVPEVLRDWISFSRGRASSDPLFFRGSELRKQSSTPECGHPTFCCGRERFRQWRSELLCYGNIQWLFFSGATHQQGRDLVLRRDRLTGHSDLPIL